MINCFQTDGFGSTSGGAYIADPYVRGGSFASVMPSSRRQLIKSTGFDGVRWTIDPATFDSAADDATLDTRIAIVIGHLESLVADGLMVIADFHTIPGPPVAGGWANTDLTASGVGGVNFERHVYCVLRFANALNARALTTLPPSKVALEPFNEPNYLDWTPMQVSMYTRLRKVLGRHTILLCGRDYSAVDGLRGTPPYGIEPDDFGNDPNVIYVWHSYEPPQFTHQGMKDGFYQDIQRLTFPPASHPGGRAQAIADFTTAANAGGRGSTIAEFTTAGNSYGLDTYFDTPCNAAWLASEVGRITTWATANGVARNQILNGETGSAADYPNGSVGASAASQAAFIAAKVQACEAAQIGWVIHELQDSHFEVSDKTTFAFNTTLLAAMGL
jgi:hypothetical protein